MGTHVRIKDFKINKKKKKEEKKIKKKKKPPNSVIGIVHSKSKGQRF